jgi:hypothetical protein
LKKEERMQSDTDGSYATGYLHKALNALIWLQTMIWCFALVGAVGLSTYAYFENPEPWASIAEIWMILGGLTGAVLLATLLLAGCSRLLKTRQRVSFAGLSGRGE